MKLVSGGVAEPIAALGKAIDDNVTNDEERAQAYNDLQELLQKPHMMQALVSMKQAGHRNFWVAGARPAILWVCAAALSVEFLVNPILEWITNKPSPTLDTGTIITLIFSLLGLGGLRTFEKVKGVAK